MGSARVNSNLILVENFFTEHTFVYFCTNALLSILFYQSTVSVPIGRGYESLCDTVSNENLGSLKV